MKDLIIQDWTRASWVYIAKTLEFRGGVPNCVMHTFIYLMLQDNFDNMIKNV